MSGILNRDKVSVLDKVHEAAGYGKAAIAKAEYALTVAEAASSSSITGIVDNSTGTVMTFDSSNNVGIGVTPVANHVVAAGAASGSAFSRIRSSSIANGDIVSYTVEGLSGGSVVRNAALGVYKHAGLTNAAGYLQLYADDGAINYVWADTGDILRISTSGGNIGTTTGTVVGSQTSDERVKSNIAPMQYGLAEIKQLATISFTYNDDVDNKPRIGFSAQQVLPIIPEAVYDTGEDVDGTENTELAMEYVNIVPVLVNAIKELSAEVTNLEARIATLEAV